MARCNSMTVEPNEDARMRQIIAEMSVISEARGQQFGDIIQGGNEPSRAPKGPRSSMAQYFARAWRRAHSVQQRQETLEEAEKALHNARHAPKRELVVGTTEWRRAIADDPQSAKEVSWTYGVSTQHVYHVRAEVERMRKTGRC